MNRIYRIAGLLLFSVLFFQCQKEVSYKGAPDSGISLLSDPITATLQGNITDENNQPAAGVTITTGTQTTITNTSGYFRITDASLDQNSSLITADKAGYFKGYRILPATSGTNQVFIKLVKRILAGTVVASSGGSASLSNGAKISLPANSVVLASSGNAYTGDVKIYASYIDPQADDIAQTLPGSLAANDKNGKRVILSSYGILAVELESAAGEKLQVKSGAVATLTTPIPLSSVSAPSSIALWYMDEQTGIWKEEGMAAKQGSTYVGDVKHFSYWNNGLAHDAVTLSMTLHNPDGLPLVHVAIRVRSSDSASFAHEHTDSLGQVKGLVPANKNLVLEVLNPCGNVVYSQNISPLTQNKNLGVIQVANATSSIVSIKGKLVDCSNLPVKKGYAIINYGNIIRYAATNAGGEFVTTFTSCTGVATTAQVIGVDQSTQLQSSPGTVTISVPVTSTGTITVCGISVTQFINYTVDGINYSITTASNDSISSARSAVISPNEINFVGVQKSPGTNYLRLNLKNISTTGTYPVNGLRLQVDKNLTLIQPFTVTFTSYPKTAGEFYEGTFSGQYKTDSVTTVVHTISSSFKVR